MLCNSALYSPGRFFTLRHCGGFAAIGMALCYLAMALIFFGVLSQPQHTDTVQKIQYVAQHYALITIGYAIGYLVFGFLLAVMVTAIAQHLPQPDSALLKIASLFGKVWVVLMMASGMIALTGLERAVRLLSTDPQLAVTLFHVQGLMTAALGGGIELVGGLWILLFSTAALQQAQHNTLHWVGMFSGCCAVLTLFPALPYLKEAFGLSQLLWLLWFGMVLLQQNQSGRD